MASTHDMIESYLDELAFTGDLTPAGISYFKLIGIHIRDVPYERKVGSDSSEERVSYYNRASLAPDVFIRLIREPLVTWVEGKLNEEGETRDYKELCHFFMNDVFPKQRREFSNWYDLKTVPEVGVLLSDIIADYIEEQCGEKGLNHDTIGSIRSMLKGLPGEDYKVDKETYAFLEGEYKGWVNTELRDLCRDDEFYSKFDDVYTNYDLATDIEPGYVTHWGPSDPDSYPPTVRSADEIKVDIHPLSFADFYMGEDIVDDAVCVCPEIRNMILNGAGPSDELAQKLRNFCTTWIVGFMMDPKNIREYANFIVDENKYDLGLRDENMLDGYITNEDLADEIANLFVRDRDNKELSWDWLDKDNDIPLSR